MDNQQEISGAAQNFNHARNILTAEDVGERLRISVATVHHLTRMGQIKGIKVGRQWHYDEKDVENYLAGSWEESIGY